MPLLLRMPHFITIDSWGFSQKNDVELAKIMFCAINVKILLQSDAKKKDGSSNKTESSDRRKKDDSAKREKEREERSSEKNREKVKVHRKHQFND